MAEAGDLSGKTILIAPLDWGLGHASRSVHLIKELSANNRVLIGTSPVTALLLRSYFPGTEQVDLPSYGVTYRKKGPQWLALLLQFPAIMRTIRKERELTLRYVKEKNVEVIISDNRYGVYSPSTLSIFVCHQLNFNLDLFPRLIGWLHRRFMSRFSEVWIPDYEKPGNRLAGKLSDPSRLKIAHRFIGPLSALKGEENQGNAEFDILVLLSGPEPQRTLLERLLVKELSNKNKCIALVRGSATVPQISTGFAFCRNLCTGPELKGLIARSKMIICRSGYSTLMDLHVLGKKEMMLIPTPGQPEQKYLAAYWKEKFGAEVVGQEELKEWCFESE